MKILFLTLSLIVPSFAFAEEPVITVEDVFKAQINEQGFGYFDCTFKKSGESAHLAIVTNRATKDLPPYYDFNFRLMNRVPSDINVLMVTQAMNCDADQCRGKTFEVWSLYSIGERRAVRLIDSAEHKVYFMYDPQTLKFTEIIFPDMLDYCRP